MIIGLIVVAIVAIFCLLNVYYLKVILAHSQENYILRGKKGKYDYISFGSAYCRYGFDFEGFVSGYNFGYGSQFLYYTDKMLREYAPISLKKGGVVFLVIADLVFAEVGKGIYCSKQMQRLLSKESLGDEYSIIKRIRYNYLPLLNPRLLVKTICHLFRYGFSDVPDLYSTLQSNELNVEETLIAAQKRCDDWCRQFDFKDTFSTEELLPHREVFNKTTKILTGMIQFCLDQGFKPILVVMPVSKSMNSLLRKEFMDFVLYSNIKKANAQNVPFFDYLRDSRFQDEDLYHNNADFLNAKGRRLFTATLLKDTAALLTSHISR